MIDITLYVTRYDIYIFITYILWPDVMWYTGMWSPSGDQSGQWRSISMTSQRPFIMTSQWAMTLLRIRIVKSQRIMTLLGTSIVTSQWVMTLLCVHIYHGITMYNDIAMNLFYYVFSALCLIMILLCNKNKNKFMFDQLWEHICCFFV